MSVEPNGQVRTCDGGALSAAELEAVEAYIRPRLAEPIRVGELAAAIGRSESCFTRLFKSSVGETPRQFVLRRRVEAAKDLIIRDNGLSLTAIALRCGFADQPHFTRAFKRVTGQTPAQFCRGERSSG